jgi:hypothetical protein
LNILKVVYTTHLKTWLVGFVICIFWNFIFGILFRVLVREIGLHNFPNSRFGRIQKKQQWKKLCLARLVFVFNFEGGNHNSNQMSQVIDSLKYETLNANDFILLRVYKILQKCVCVANMDWSFWVNLWRIIV